MDTQQNGHILSKQIKCRYPLTLVRALTQFYELAKKDFLFLMI